MAVLAPLFFSPQKTLTNTKGIVFQITETRWISLTSQPFSAQLSTDGGATWVTKYEHENPFYRTLLRYVASNGDIYAGSSVSGLVAAVLIRSKDNGETWEVVLEADSNGLWGMTENAAGHLFVQEYSMGVDETDDTRGHNIWKSADGGDTWSKWYTADADTRHGHTIFIDSDDNLISSWGERNSGLNGGRMFYHNSDGTVDFEIINDMRDNGWLSMIELPNGTIIATGDYPPNRIVQFQKGTNNTVEELINLTDRFGSDYDSPMYTILKGEHGVLYVGSSGEGGKIPVLLASADDGATWFMHPLPVSATVLSKGIGKIFLRQSDTDIFTFSFPDYTKEQFSSLAKTNPSWSTLTICR